MKNLKDIACSGVVLLLTTLAFFSCVDGNDWEVDSSYDRLFSITKISVTVGDTEAEIRFTPTLNNEYFIIEVSKDSLYDDIEMGVATGSIVFGEDKSITESPYTLVGLEGSTEYYFRMRAMSSKKPVSRWSYLDDVTFKTKSEQIVTGIEATANTATLKWTAGVEIDRMELLKGEEYVKDIPLTSEALATGTLTIEDLESSTSYTVNLYNGANRRGYTTFQTAAAIPQNDHIEFLVAGDSINQALFDGFAAAGHESVTLVLESGALYAYNGTVKVPNGMSVSFFGAAGKVKPILGIKLVDIEGSHSFLHFTNLEITGEVYEEGTKTGSKNDYLINQSTTASVDEVKFEDCIIHDYNNAFIRFQKEDALKVIKSLIIENSICYGTPADYAFIHVNKAGAGSKIDRINLSNSTFHTIQRFIQHDTSNNSALRITDCTINNTTIDARYFIDYSGTYGPTEEFIIYNTIVGKSYGLKARGIRSIKPYAADNFWQTSDWVTGSNAISFTDSYPGTSYELFADPDNGDFTIIDNSFGGRRTAGDPRWRME